MPNTEEHCNVCVVTFKQGGDVSNFITLCMAASSTPDLKRLQNECALYLLLTKDGKPIDNLVSFLNRAANYRQNIPDGDFTV